MNHYFTEDFKSTAEWKTEVVTYTYNYCICGYFSWGQIKQECQKNTYFNN